MPTRNIDTPRRARASLCAVLLLCGLLGGCAPRGEDSAWLRSELYFGMSIPGGGTVSDTDWKGFLAKEVTPRFPDGLTVVPATGQWRNAKGAIVSETTRVVVILHPVDPDTRLKIDAIRAAYCTRFKQECVILATQSARVAF